MFWGLALQKGEWKITYGIEFHNSNMNLKNNYKLIKGGLSRKRTERNASNVQPKMVGNNC